jgi:hypothetical protein
MGKEFTHIDNQYYRDLTMPKYNRYLESIRVRKLRKISENEMWILEIFYDNFIKSLK